MKKMIAALCALALAACVGGKMSSVENYSELAHHRYIMKSFNGEAVTPASPEKLPRIEFNEGGNISGAVCNVYNGQSTLEGGKLKAQVMATKMFCFSEVLNKAESALFAAFTEGADLSLSGNNLTLKHAGNTFEFELSDYVK